MTNRERKLEVYLVRHGRSKSNDASDTILGPRERGWLFDVGVDQSKFGMSLGKAGVVAAAVCSSLAVRARSTAVLAREAAGLGGAVSSWSRTLAFTIKTLARGLDAS